MDEVKTIEVIQETVDLAEVELLLQQNNEMLQNLANKMVENTIMSQHIYVSMLFALGTLAAIGVCVLLYKFIKQFY